MFHLAGNLISPAGDRARLAIMIYHRALAALDPMLHDEIDAAALERQMSMLAAEFNVLTLREAVERLARGALPARAVCITFDDGYADNERIALPLLKRLGLPATFFVATGFSGGDLMFNDGIIEAVRRAPDGRHDLSTLGLDAVELGDAGSRRAAADRWIDAVKYRPVRERRALVERIAGMLRVTLPRNLMMTPAQIGNLHREGMEIGAHTVNHPILSSVPDEQARAEIIDSKRILEDIIGEPVTSFAYPNGKPGMDYGRRHVALVKDAGYTAAVSTASGVAHCGSDPFQLPRFVPWERNPRRLGLRLLAGCMRRTDRPVLQQPRHSPEIRSDWSEHR